MLKAQEKSGSIFLDWVRTLCSTRGGASPLSGSRPHTLNPDLRTLLCTVPQRCRIVTRSTRRDDIITFLGQHGVPAIPITTVSKNVPKSSIVCSSEYRLPGGAVFIDDTIRELVDDTLNRCVIFSVR